MLIITAWAVLPVLQLCIETCNSKFRLLYSINTRIKGVFLMLLMC